MLRHYVIHLRVAHLAEADIVDQHVEDVAAIRCANFGELGVDLFVFGGPLFSVLSLNEFVFAVVDDVEQAVAWFNRYSPRFAASLISEDEGEHERFFAAIDAPFVGNGFTRWVDGQYALSRPELGLSNWQSGRLFGRGGILSGDSAFTVRTRVVQENLDLGR